MVACLYDTAVFYTDEEYYKTSGIRWNVHASVEKPFLYVLARSSSNDQQLLYTDERLQDILQIQQSLTANDGMKVHDVIRAFKNDYPASQFESGQQKGGTYPCHGCSIDINCAKSIPHSFKRKTISLNDRIVKIHSSIPSEDRLRRNDTIKLCNKLDLPNLIDEHQQRNLSTPQLMKQHLQSSLDIEMHGIQSMPDLLFNNPLSSLKTSNLTKYEILVNEPLHDISNHMKNIQQEVPHHVGKDKKRVVNDVIISTFNGKEAKNSADHS